MKRKYYRILSAENWVLIPSLPSGAVSKGTRLTDKGLASVYWIPDGQGHYIVYGFKSGWLFGLPERILPQWLTSKAAKITAAIVAALVVLFLSRNKRY